jgi:hypothetical protein
MQKAISRRDLWILKQQNQRRFRVNQNNQMQAKQKTIFLHGYIHGYRVFGKLTQTDSCLIFVLLLLFFHSFEMGLIE